MFRVPLDFDPNSAIFIAVAAPSGGVGNFPALVQGDPGPAPTLETAIDLTALEYGDPTADSAVWTETSPDTYRLALTLHKGEPGDTVGASLIEASDLTGTPVAGKIIVVDSGATGFQYESPKVGDRYIPATINNTPAGNAAYTLATVVVAAQPWDWRPVCTGQCVATGTGADVAVDLLARLNNESAGNIVARGIGGSGVNTAGWPVVLSPGPPAGSADSYDKVSANATATLYLRAERRTGADTFTTSNTTTTFTVRVQPI